MRPLSLPYQALHCNTIIAEAEVQCTCAHIIRRLVRADRASERKRPPPPLQSCILPDSGRGAAAMTAADAGMATEVERLRAELAAERRRAEAAEQRELAT